MRQKNAVDLMFRGICIALILVGTQSLGTQAHALISAKNVTASNYQAPHIPFNTLDTDPRTRWSAQGDEVWIQYELTPNVVWMDSVAISWFRGDKRQAHFSIEYSDDGLNWQEAFRGSSSGTTTALEDYDVSSTQEGRYLRIVGRGNTVNNWTSITGVELRGVDGRDWDGPGVYLEIDTASSFQPPHKPGHTYDGDLNTRWSAEGYGQWVRYMFLGSPFSRDCWAIAWYKGDERQAKFAIEASNDGQSWQELYRSTSSGATVELEVYEFPEVLAQYYYRIVGYGNTQNQWTSITEIGVPANCQGDVSLPIAKITASDFQAPNVPARTQDGDPMTRWSALGDGVSIEFNFSWREVVRSVAIGWYRGNQRQASFTIESSNYGSTWHPVFRGRSSGTTTSPEVYTFPYPIYAQYIRIVGHGNTDNQWTSITSIDIRGAE